MTIWKFTLAPTDSQDIDMPRGAQPISVGIQNDALCVWVLVNPDREKVPHRFAVYGTGHHIAPERAADQFLGTVHLLHGTLVFHVWFEGEAD